jgi:hypothetical protein
VSESEAGFQTWVVAAARLYGWTVAHFRPAKTNKGWRTPVSADGKGYPDLTMCHSGRDGMPARLIFAELKAARGKLSPEQAAWMERLSLVRGVETYVWRPTDREAIAVILRGKFPPP